MYKLMMNFIAAVITLLYLCEQITSKNLRVVHYNNVTLANCGFNAFSSKPAHKRCFKWHQTILEQKQSLLSIKGGRYAQIGEFPYTVLLERGGRPMCTAAIINDRWVITAAHCLDDDYRDIKIYTGITDFPKYSLPPISTKNFYLHENFTNRQTNKTDTDYDIGLIKMDTRIDLSTNKANGVCLPSPEFKIVFEKELATVTGWGWLNDTERNLKRLKMTQIKLGNIAYNNTLGRMWSNDMKYGHICDADSGGPLVQYVNGRAVLIGISSHVIRHDSLNEAKTCYNLNFIAFTAIPRHLNWIIETIRHNTVL